MKNIRQLSGELGISKEAIYKKLKYQLKEELAGHVTKFEGVTHIDAEGERFIRESLRTERREALEGVLEVAPYESPGESSPARELITVLEEQIKTKDEQLETQSEHISMLIRQLGGSQLLIHAERIRSLSRPKEQETAAFKTPRPKPIWRRLFKRQT